MSRTYLRKTELISKCIVASATLSRSVNDRDVLVGLSRRINQQKLNSSAYSSTFHRNKDELLSFTCENNTNLTLEKVSDTLIDIQNSNNNIFAIDVLDLHFGNNKC